MYIDRSNDMTTIASLGLLISNLFFKKVTKNIKILTGKQVLQYTEPSTGVQVILIGAMHYNPARYTILN